MAGGEIVERSANEVAVRPKGELQAAMFYEANPVLDRNEKNVEKILSAISAQMPAGMNLAQANSLAEAYKTVDNVALQIGSAGNYTAVLRDENGKIVEHVPLQKASSGFATAVKESFAVNCAIAGQAQMMQVSKQLEKIQDALTEAKDRDFDKVINAVVSSMQSFREAVNISSDATARITMIHSSRNALRTALLDVYSFMEEQLKRIPKETSSSGLFDNWGFGKTKSEEAGEYFKYFARLLPVYCRGMAMFAMTDAFVEENVNSSGMLYAKHLQELLEKHEVLKRTALVPTIGGVDPARLIEDFSNGVDVAVSKFEQFGKQMESGQLKLAIPIR